MMPLLHFFMLIALCLLGGFWFFGLSFFPHGEDAPPCPEDFVAWQVSGGDTCWNIANRWGVSVDELRGWNEGVNCIALRLGQMLCLRKTDG